jgi:hypothetical protein
MLGIPLVAMVVALAAPAARAPSPMEQKAFTDGLRLYERGDALGAARVWQEGYAAGHDPAFLVRIGEAQEKAGAPAQAIQSYQQYLRESPDAADRDDIEARLRRLAPPASTAPGQTAAADATATPGELPMPAPGPAPPSATAGAPPAQIPSVPAPATPQARDDAREDLRPIVDEDQPARSRLNTIAWVGAGVTALLLGVAAFYGASAADKSGDANRLLTYIDQDTGAPLPYGPNAQQFESDVRVGQHDDRVAKGFLITAGVAALVTGALFVIDSTHDAAKSEPRASARTNLRARVAASGGLSAGAGLGVGWSF